MPIWLGEKPQGSVVLGALGSGAGLPRGALVLAGKAIVLNNKPIVMVS